MPDELQLILAFGAAAGLVQLTVPLAIRLALATGFLDHPVGYKKHGRATPYLGGLGVMAAALPVALVVGGGSDVLVIVACAAGLCVVGIDRRPRAPRPARPRVLPSSRRPSRSGRRTSAGCSSTRASSTWR